MSIIGFIGFGLIGGSIAAALKQTKEPPFLLIYSPAKSKIEFLAAIEQGLADQIVENLIDLSICDILFLCAPIEANINYLKQCSVLFGKDMLITDVSSVKFPIQEAASKLSMETCFLGGHPMAGSEKTGFLNASPRLFENAYYILTPSESFPKESLEKIIDLIKKIKAIPILLDAQTHDTITAAISHLPHILAAELVNLVAFSEDKDKMKELAAGGFKDITRIASSSPALWEGICLANQSAIKATLDRFIHSLQQVSKAFDQKDSLYLYQRFETASTFRDSLPDQQNGLLSRVYELFLDLEDKAGAIAKTAGLLAGHEINIKNIGIVHNREFQQGVLRIEFYAKEAQQKAALVLRDASYVLYGGKL